MNTYTSVGNENSASIDQKAESVTTIKAMRLASLVTAINVLVASGFAIAAIISPQLVVPAGSVPTEASLILALYAAARTIPLALFALAAIYKRATSALLILGTLAGAMQLLDAGIGVYEERSTTALFMRRCRVPERRAAGPCVGVRSSGRERARVRVGGAAGWF